MVFTRVEPIILINSARWPKPGNIRSQNMTTQRGIRDRLALGTETASLCQRLSWRLDEDSPINQKI